MEIAETSNGIQRFIWIGSELTSAFVPLCKAGPGVLSWLNNALTKEDISTELPVHDNREALKRTLELLANKMLGREVEVTIDKNGRVSVIPRGWNLYVVFQL